MYAGDGGDTERKRESGVRARRDRSIGLSV